MSCCNLTPPPPPSTITALEEIDGGEWVQFLAGSTLTTESCKENTYRFRDKDNCDNLITSDGKGPGKCGLKSITFPEIGKIGDNCYTSDSQSQCLSSSTKYYDNTTNVEQLGFANYRDNFGIALAAWNGPSQDCQNQNKEAQYKLLDKGTDAESAGPGFFFDVNCIVDTSGDSTLLKCRKGTTDGPYNPTDINSEPDITFTYTK